MIRKKHIEGVIILRLYVSNTKEQIVFLLFDFLDSMLKEKVVKLIFNGTPYEGLIEKIELDEDDYEWIKFKITDEIIKFPFTDDSKVRLDKDLFYFETKSNTILLYL
jgi:hypothetical protein